MTRTTLVDDPPLTRDPEDGPTEDEIRVRAYEKWEQAGRPDGDGVRFWVEAEEELRASP
jgi:hypothetical protein